MSEDRIIEEVPGLYRIMPLKIFRKTQKVTFDFVPIDVLPGIDAIDRVIHEGSATSPGPVGSIERPWYMHPFQDDNLIVLHGTRHMEIYTPEHGRIEQFTATPHQVMKNGQVIYVGGAVLSWPRNVFHRIQSGSEGSAAINLAVHYEGFNIRTNFSVYNLNITTGEYRMIREGHLDQPTA